jgi:hypothetical protein
VTVTRLVAWGQGLGQGPWGWFPLLTVATGLSVSVVAAAYTLGRLQVPWAGVLFWLAFPLAVVPIAFVLLRKHRPRRERIALVALLGIAQYLPYLLRSPAEFKGYDVLLHFRSVEDIVRSGQLFQPNPLLTVSPYFPGLEIVTAAVTQLSGADPFAAGVALLATVRILFAVALFLLFEEASSSARVAGLAAAIYMLNPSFAFFSSAFAYESLALPLMTLVLLLTAIRARSSSTMWRAVLSIVLLIMLATAIITHHVSSYLLVALLAAWTAIHVLFVRNARQGASVATVALVTTSGVVVWLFSVASITLGYLVPPLDAAVREAARLITTGEGRQLFQSATGELAPLWERLAGIGSTGILLGWMPIGIGAILLRRRHSSLALLLLVVALGYPASLVLRLTPTGSEAAGRSSAIIFLGLALVVAYGIVSFRGFVEWMVSRLPGGRPLVTRHLFRFHRPWRAFTAASFGLLAVGGVILGTTPATRLPGPYLVGADFRSIDDESTAAAVWARGELGQDHRFAADRVNRLLLGAYGVQEVVFHHSARVETWQLFLGPDIGLNELRRLRRLELEYLLIDRRLSRTLPLVGFYYEEGEVAHGRHTTPISPATLGKWDADPDADRIFDSGELQIYDVRRLSRAP